MKSPRSKYFFSVTVTAEDGSHPHRFYGLDVAAANRAIAYASKQLGREFCALVPSEEWLNSHYLYSSVVDDFGRVITLEQSWDNTEPHGVPAAKPVCTSARRCMDDSCDGGHCRKCGGHFLDFYCGQNGERTCDSCAREEWQLKDAAAENACLRSDGFDPRAPFPRASDPHWSDPRADFGHW